MNLDFDRDRDPAAPAVPVPDGWTADRDGSTLTLQSPDTCFWTFTVLPDGPDPADAVDSAVAGLRAEYEGLESARVAGPALVDGEASLDAAFFCLDATVAARVRAFSAGGVTYLLFYQGLDREVDDRRGELEALSRRVAGALAAFAGEPAAEPFAAPALPR